MNFCKYLALVCVSIFSMSANGETFPFNVDKYFAYFKIPDQDYGTVQQFSPYMFLSNEKCLASKVDNKKAKQAISYWPISRETRHECWAEFDGNITICPIAKGKRGLLGNGCIDIGKSRFLDVSNIPRAANFSK